MSLKRTAVFAAVALSLLSVLFFIYYELNLDAQDPNAGLTSSVHIMTTKIAELEHEAVVQIFDPVQEAVRRFRAESFVKGKDDDDAPLEGNAPEHRPEEAKPVVLSAAEQEPEDVLSSEELADLNFNKKPAAEVNAAANVGHGDSGSVVATTPTAHDPPSGSVPSALTGMDKKTRKTLEKRGLLKCPGKDPSSDSEVIYWKVVPGDVSYESPITPHHGIHHDRYLTFEYDQGGWNNIRMGMEVFIVVAHAMGRTLVLPPAQNLYLLYEKHKGKGDHKAHSEMGFEDFYDFSLLKSHQGMHVISMEEFLKAEAIVGGLRGRYPPGNDTTLHGPRLWNYLQQSADVTPRWGGKYVAFPAHAGDFDLNEGRHLDEDLIAKMKEFGGQRTRVYYDESLQEAHHIHFSSDREHRVLQHFYSFAFFANKEMRSFYKRFVRDYLRYNDDIQCSGDALVRAVREDARKLNPSNTNGDFYALHIRRGDLQFKEVKLGTPDLLKNLHFPNGTLMFPPGSLVYISTDDPEGICKGCRAGGKLCTLYDGGPDELRPLGCPADPSWKAFIDAGWKVRFLKDYLAQGVIRDANPNTYGMVESIVCSRAVAFAGTFRSTFTGYIHRIRGYHGLAETTYYHSTGHVMDAISSKTVGHGFSREFRQGWVDDEVGLI